MQGMKHVVLTLLALVFASPALALELELPVTCTVGTDCWVQQYADHDPGKGATDFACGVASYDGHDGTDIRALNTASRIDVVAAAAGTVKAVRDGVADNLVKTEADRAAVSKIECGNGVVVAHEDGWETQYCHLRKGSVVVKAGDQVQVGTKLGVIGYSGEAAFPHVHLSVRKDGKKVDPFSADGMTDCKAADKSLWSGAAQKTLAYQGNAVLLMQWAERVYEPDEVDSGALAVRDPQADWPALVVHAEAINLYADDTLVLTVKIPGQEPVVNRIVMERNRALQRLHAGKKKRGDWPKGLYESRFEVVRQGVVMLEKTLSFEMK